ncbi:MAG TPA: nucleotidyltransferase family protein [Bryobacteraceae bacterium]|nr:nucleotidyltransferase family protein [Bryobacteraceae bacterium]
MVTLETLRGEKRAEILRVAEAHGARNIRVFGSVVRGDNRDDSDVDLLVEFEEGKTLFDLIGLKSDLQLLLGATVDVVTPNSLRYIRDRVLAEALPI